MNVTVIFTTYNSPEWLEKVLWGFVFQTHSAFEIIIADDGSTEDTKQLIDAMRAKTGMDISHIWQQDKGFRKSRILNKAILAAKNGYIVFTDGDCIPRTDFLAVHISEAQKGYYLSGSYYKLPMSISRVITKDDIATGRCFDVKWLIMNGLPKRRKTLKLRANGLFAAILNKITPTRCNLKGSNASAWRDDILAVNGYDERMAYGGEDREFGVRLINSGVKPKHVRYNAICVHLDHSRGYKDADMVAGNKSLRVNNERNGVATTKYGISQLGSED
ncbi:MAG: glycosyltransferase involved in cell wall biosynthesis [Alphaproteobacteria bacterium]|jgi:glycosyltransferase involved in cell wall biosynthesis